MSRQPSWNDDDLARASADPDALPLEISHRVMDAAFESGEAKALGQGIWWAVRYADTWWVQYENGWLRVTDEATRRDLDHVAARLADTSTTAQADISRIQAEGTQAPTGTGEADGW